MADRMPPPGGSKGPGIVIAVGVPKPGAGPGGKMPPPGSSPAKTDDPQGKHSREEADFVPESHHCKNCENYDPQSGECSEVEGTMDMEDACRVYFEPIDEADGGSEDPDEAMESREAQPDTAK